MEALLVALTAFAGVGIRIAQKLDRNDPDLPGRCSCLTARRHLIHTLTVRLGGNHNHA